MERARPYADGVRSTSWPSSRSAAGESQLTPCSTKREGNRTLLVVVTSDRGLCGGVQQRTCSREPWRATSNEQHRPRGRRSTSIGKQGRRTSSSSSRNWCDPPRPRGRPAQPGLRTCPRRRSAGALIKAFLEDGLRRGPPRLQPLQARSWPRTLTSSSACCPPACARETEARGDERRSSRSFVDYIHEPSPAELLSGPSCRGPSRRIVHQALLESYAAEMGARMVAMETATKNASGDDRQAHPRS